MICIVQEHQACSPSPQSSFKKQRIHSPAKINRPIESNELQEKDDRLPEQSALNVLFQAKEVYTLGKLGGKACWKAVRDTYWHRLNEGTKLDSTSLSSDDK